MKGDQILGIPSDETIRKDCKEEGERTGTEITKKYFPAGLKSEPYIPLHIFFEEVIKTKSETPAKVNEVIQE